MRSGNDFGKARSFLSLVFQRWDPGRHGTCHRTCVEHLQLADHADDDEATMMLSLCVQSRGPGTTSNLEQGSWLQGSLSRGIQRQHEGADAQTLCPRVVVEGARSAVLSPQACAHGGRIQMMPTTSSGTSCQSSAGNRHSCNYAQVQGYDKRGPGHNMLTCLALRGAVETGIDEDGHRCVPAIARGAVT